MKVFLQLVVGDAIRPKWLINDSRIMHWTYSKECSPVGGGILPNATLKVVEINSRPGDRWLRAEIDGSYGTRHLKITAEEYVMNFVSVH